ncbi:MAG TPA: transglutaminase family protein [Pirellulales bacterium]|nr:transglutaminase family protein [Pirellulales bacterium]
MRLLVLVSIIGLAASTASAQQFVETESKGPRLDKQQTQLLAVGMVVTAATGPCQGIIASASVPTDWPEQQVQEASRDISPIVRDVGYRDIGSVRQMAVSMPFIPAGDECKAIVVYEVKRHSLLPPKDTSIFVLPNTKKLKLDQRIFLAPSPHIEPTHAKIKAIAKETFKSKETAWEKVEALYDYVRAHVEFVSGPLKTTAQTLKDGKGDSEELSSLFVAFCRACDVPARLVFLACPGHCYAEFYLEDAEGKGYWFPCRPAGNREFGGIEDFRPIIQKGDSFALPDRPRERLRFVNEHLTGTGGQPEVKFIRELVTQ